MPMIFIQGEGVMLIYNLCEKVKVSLKSFFYMKAGNVKVILSSHKKTQN